MAPTVKRDHSPPAEEKLYNTRYAEELLVHFVKWFAYLYDPEQISHNIHGLIQLANDARMFGSLDQFSAFKFENYMKTLKNI